MKKLFYTCPIEAAYMAKNFGVKLICGAPDYPRYYDDYANLMLRYVDVNISDYGMTEEKSFDIYDKSEICIHPDSLPIFEPQEGDLIDYIDDIGYNRVAFLEMWFSPKNGLTGIIRRDKKPFIMPQEAE